MMTREWTTGLKTACILFALGVLTRIPFASKILFSLDSVQFALGLDDYNVPMHQPHPPGYFLYVMTGRLARLLFHDPNTALVSISVVTGALTVVMVYLFGREVFDEAAGLAAGLFALTSPLIWFHGEVALSYMPEALMSIALAYVCLRMERGEAGLYWLAAVILGVSGGIRQNTMVFLMPLWLYSMRGVGLKRAVEGFLIFGVTVAAWFLPMVDLSGGYAAYSSALRCQWLNGVWTGISFERTMRHAEQVVHFVFYGLGLASAPIAALLYFRLRGKASLGTDNRTALFFLVWMAPGLLFHVLVFFQPGAPGYVLIYLVGVVVLSGRALTLSSEAVGGGHPGRFAVNVGRSVLALIVVTNVSLFLFSTDAISASGIREHDLATQGYVNAIRAGFSPADTEIVGSDRFVCSYRHAMYYLPEFRVHDAHYILTAEGPRVFWGQGRKTGRERSFVPAPSTRHFIYFVNYSKRDLAGLPATAKSERVYGDYYLVYFDDLEGVRSAADIAPVTTARASR